VTPCPEKSLKTAPTALDISSVIMALLSFVALAVVGAVLAIAKYTDNVRKNRLPAGVKKLPGPKGMMNNRAYCFYEQS